MAEIPSIRLDPKTPGEALNYGVNFADELGTATISSRSVSLVRGSVGIGAAGGAGGVVLARISGGAANERVVLLAEANTSDGMILQCYLRFTIMPPPA